MGKVGDVAPHLFADYRQGGPRCRCGSRHIRSLAGLGEAALAGARSADVDTCVLEVESLIQLWEIAFTVLVLLPGGTGGDPGARPASNSGKAPRQVGGPSYVSGFGTSTVPRRWVPHRAEGGQRKVIFLPMLGNVTVRVETWPVGE
jgi:hypothetical protein